MKLLHLHPIYHTYYIPGDGNLHQKMKNMKHWMTMTLGNYHKQKITEEFDCEASYLELKKG
jgi:hypothetical protein